MKKMDPIAVIVSIVAISSLISGFLIGKFLERTKWNELMAEKNINPQNWNNVPYQHDGYQRGGQNG